MNVARSAQKASRRLHAVKGACNESESAFFSTLLGVGPSRTVTGRGGGQAAPPSYQWNQMTHDDGPSFELKCRGHQSRIRWLRHSIPTLASSWEQSPNPRSWSDDGQL
jgi:hypothetical protein